MSVATDVNAAIKERIDKDLDSWMSGLYTFIDVTKALPHPYDAVNDMAVGLIHDYTAMAYRIKRFLTRDIVSDREDRLYSILEQVREWEKTYAGQWIKGAEPTTFDRGVGAAAHDILEIIAPVLEELDARRK